MLEENKTLNKKQAESTKEEIKEIFEVYGLGGGYFGGNIGPQKI